MTIRSGPDLDAGTQLGDRRSPLFRMAITKGTSSPALMPLVTSPVVGSTEEARGLETERTSASIDPWRPFVSVSSEAAMGRLARLLRSISRMRVKGKVRRMLSSSTLSW